MEQVLEQHEATAVAARKKKEEKEATREQRNIRRKTEINDSINDSFLSCLGLKLPINDSINVFGFESLWKSRLCHLSRLCTRD
jgi:hypothetical protein